MAAVRRRRAGIALLAAGGALAASAVGIVGLPLAGSGASGAFGARLRSSSTTPLSSSSTWAIPLPSTVVSPPTSRSPAERTAFAVRPEPSPAGSSPMVPTRCSPWIWTDPADPLEPTGVSSASGPHAQALREPVGLPRAFALHGAEIVLGERGRVGGDEPVHGRVRRRGGRLGDRAVHVTGGVARVARGALLVGIEVRQAGAGRREIRGRGARRERPAPPANPARAPSARRRARAGRRLRRRPP